GVLNNGMSILGIDANWQRAVKGSVLLVAVLIDVQSRKKRGKSTKGIFGLGRGQGAEQEQGQESWQAPGQVRAEE
ncbi:MAG: hypothetical protein FWG03_08825, partial [Clostridiales bacterium]|nr:hypothetical protein [Clostridiales bacterium]